jgi:hypothetical protein
MEAVLWHIDSAQSLDAMYLTSTGDAPPLSVMVFRATHIPIGVDGVLDHPMRRTSLNIWAQISLTESSIRDIRERYGMDEPIWIGLPLCCQQPSFWGADVPEALPDIGTSTSTEGASWAMEASK